VAVVVVAFDGSVLAHPPDGLRFLTLLDRPVHSFDPRRRGGGLWPLVQGCLIPASARTGLGEPVLNPVLVAPHVEHVGHIGGCGAVGMAWRESELDAPFGEAQDRIIGQHRVDFAWPAPAKAGGTAVISAARKAEAVTLLALLTNWTKANFDVRSMPT
jgi:hypothetical protein